MRPGKVSISFDHMFRSGAINKVVVKRSTFRAERIGVASFLAEVEPAPPGVVEKNPVVAPAADGEEKRDALVDGVDRFLRTDVGIPESKSLVSAVEGACLVARPK